MNLRHTLGLLGDVRRTLQRYPDFLSLSIQSRARDIHKKRAVATYTANKQTLKLHQERRGIAKKKKENVPATILTGHL